MRHKRGRDSVFNLLAAERLIANRNDMPVNANTCRSIGNEQQIAAVTLHQFLKPSIELDQGCVSHLACLSRVILRISHMKSHLATVTHQKRFVAAIGKSRSRRGKHWSN